MKTRTPIRQRPTLVLEYERKYSHEDKPRKYRVVTRRRPKEGLAAFRRRHSRKVYRALNPRRGIPGYGALSIRPV